MKRIWIAAGLLLVILAGTLAHSFYISEFTTRLTGLLEQAEARVEAGDWADALEYHQQAHQCWESKELYLHLLLRHKDADDIYLSFHEVQKYLSCQEVGEYSAANAKLIAELELLTEAEQLTVKNIL